MSFGPVAVARTFFGGSSRSYKINFSIAGIKYNFIADPPIEFQRSLKEKYLKIF